MNRRNATAGVFSTLLSASARSAFAQDAGTFPTRPVRLVVGYSAGGTTDVLGRILAQRLQEALGQPVVVENRPGTNGVVGATLVARSPHDGHTLLVGASGQIVFNAAVNPNVSFAPERDFTPISTIARFPLVLSVKHGSKVTSIADLITLTKEDPARSNYASSAYAFQLASELLKQKTGIQAQHVPYKGSSESMAAVASGEVTFTMLDTGTAAGALRGKLLRGVAVTSDDRLEAFSDIPTFKELGIDLGIQLWTGLLAPAGTPPSIVAKLEREVARAVAHSESVKAMGQLNVQPRAMSATDFRRLISAEIAYWGSIARDNRINFQ